MTDIESVGTTFDGQMDPVLVVTKDDLESEVGTSPGAEVANVEWEQHYKLCVPALVGQEDPGMDTGSPVTQPDVLKPPVLEVEMTKPLEEVEADEPLEVVLNDDRSLQVSVVLDRGLEPAQTAEIEETIPISPHMDTDMVVTDTAELEEV